MSSLSIADYRKVLALVGDALQCAEPEFPDVGLIRSLRQLFDAEQASAADVDFEGTGSRRWADSPAQIPMAADGFHEFVIDHPLATVYRRTGLCVPLRLSDVASERLTRPTFDEFGMSRVLTIPLLITPRRLSVVALMRSGRDFQQRELDLAQHLRPILSGIYALRDRDHGSRPPCFYEDPDLKLTLTARELAVLDLLPSGLIAGAIARQLGISPRTVSKHIESIYRKLNSHDRTTAVLRAQAHGLLPWTSAHHQA